MAALCGGPVACAADGVDVIALPDPGMSGGMPLMQALKERMSTRAYSSRELPPQALSDLLWAARGISRPDTGKLTSPTARNLQEIDVYVALKSGLYLYDAAENALRRILPDDIRAVTGEQPFVADAPVNLIFVVDLSKMKGMPPGSAEFYAATDTGFASENVYLYCASEGLATVVRGWVDKEKLARAMKLRPDQMIVLAQTVGYPVE